MQMLCNASHTDIQKSVQNIKSQNGENLTEIVKWPETKLTEHKRENLE